MPAFKLSHRLIRDCRVQGLSDCWLLADEKGKPIPGMVATSVLYYCAPVVQRSTTAYQHLKELEEVGFVVKSQGQQDLRDDRAVLRVLRTQR